MGNKRYFIIRLLVILLIGIAVIGCIQNNNNLNGTWIEINDENDILVLKNGNFETYGIFKEKGTYTTNGNILKKKTTHMHSETLIIKDLAYAIGIKPDFKWYSKNEFINFFKLHDNDFTKLANEIFGIEKWSIIENTITIGSGDNKTVYIRKIEQ